MPGRARGPARRRSRIAGRSMHRERSDHALPSEFEIAGLEKVIDINVQHIIMRRLPMRPVAEEIADIGAAGPRVAPTSAGAISIWWKDWYQMLAANDCTHVAMEATGVYWKPVWHILDDGEFELVLANAAHAEERAGPQNRLVNDAMWLAAAVRSRIQEFHALQVRQGPVENYNESRPYLKNPKARSVRAVATSRDRNTWNAFTLPRAGGLNMPRVQLA